MKPKRAMSRVLLWLLHHHALLPSFADWITISNTSLCCWCRKQLVSPSLEELHHQNLLYLYLTSTVFPQEIRVLSLKRYFNNNRKTQVKLLPWHKCTSGTACAHPPLKSTSALQSVALQNDLLKRKTEPKLHLQGEHLAAHLRLSISVSPAEEFPPPPHQRTAELGAEVESQIPNTCCTISSRACSLRG